MSSRDFQRLKLDRAFERAFQLPPLEPPYPIEGAAWVARHLASYCSRRSALSLSQAAV